eukprot:13374470-Alexandrium_andersonii.AAC.1
MPAGLRRVDCKIRYMRRACVLGVPRDRADILGGHLPFRIGTGGAAEVQWDLHPEGWAEGELQ